LRKLDDYIAARQKAAKAYDIAFEGNPRIEVPFRAPNSSHAFHQYTLKLKNVNRDGLNQFLADKGIPSMIYYPIPAHKQKMFAHFDLECQLPITDELTHQVISLPMHTELEEDQLNFIIEGVKEYINLN
jgi:dTDP-4-amino-4,6-dideoxygalactose transaminase